MKESNLFRLVPSVYQIVADIQKSTNISHNLIVQFVRQYLLELRHNIASNTIQSPNQLEYSVIIQNIRSSLQLLESTYVCRAVNATGIILHTGLGRAVLPPSAMQSIMRNLAGYSVVEVDRQSGERTNRDLAVRDKLCQLTLAEDATVVNNNAGAILLVLASLACGREVIVSRGQLVEIGGSFRVPEIMALGGAKLVEIGCTNSVHLSDYEKAINSQTSAILHVHTSNFKITGFCQEVVIKELAKLCNRANILFLEDAGSGLMTDLSTWGWTGDPIISHSIKIGTDVVTFSGDKLLGGCQAGIILGRTELIKKIRKNPLYRALRVDKITLCILENVLNLYIQSRLEEIPTYHMLTQSYSKIQAIAEKIANTIQKRFAQIKVSVVESQSFAGSGSFPTVTIPSYAITLQTSYSSSELARLLRSHTVPIFSRVEKNMVFLDVRTLQPNDESDILQALEVIFNPKNDKQ